MKSVTVEVGPKGNEWAFVPAAIKVVPGTTVTWKWIEKEGGGGNPHNVVATNKHFNSGEPISSGTYYKHTFESAGKHYYYCEPHKHLGMKGAIVVADST